MRAWFFCDVADNVPLPSGWSYSHIMVVSPCPCSYWILAYITFFIIIKCDFMAFYLDSISILGYYILDCISILWHLYLDSISILSKYRYAIYTIDIILSKYRYPIILRGYPSNNHTFMLSVGSLCVGSYYIFIFIPYNCSPGKWRFPAFKSLLLPQF